MNNRSRATNQAGEKYSEFVKRIFSVVVPEKQVWNLPED